MSEIYIALLSTDLKNQNVGPHPPSTVQIQTVGHHPPTSRKKFEFDFNFIKQTPSNESNQNRTRLQF